MTNEEKRCWNCLRKLRCKDYGRMKPNTEQAPDCHVDMVTFDDDIIYLFNPDTGISKEIMFTPPYDDRIFTLEDLRELYGAKIVIHETPLHGEVYRYGNHGDFWEQIGTTEGYA